MSSPGRISPSAIGASFRPPPDSGPWTDAAPSLQTAPAAARAPARRNDRSQRTKVLGKSPAEAISTCENKAALIHREIQALVSNANAPETVLDAQTLTSLINAYQTLEKAYEEALKPLRSVPGIVSKGSSNPTAFAKLKEFLAERDKASLSHKLYLAMRHTMAADDAMQEAEDPPGLGSPALKDYEAAVHTLAALKPADLQIAQQISYQEIGNAEELLEHALFNDISIRETAFNEALEQLQGRRTRLDNEHGGALNALRKKRDRISADPKLKRQEKTEKLTDLKEKLSVHSAKLLAELPGVIQQCKALLPQNAALMERLILEKTYFPASQDNQTSLREAILADVSIRKDVNDLQSLHFHELMHQFELDARMNDAQFEHMNSMHDNVMQLHCFLEAAQAQISTSSASSGEKGNHSLGGSLEFLASELDTASQQLRHHAHIALSDASQEAQYRQAASLLAELAEESGHKPAGAPGKERAGRT